MIENILFADYKEVLITLGSHGKYSCTFTFDSLFREFFDNASISDICEKFDISVEQLKELSEAATSNMEDDEVFVYGKVFTIGTLPNSGELVAIPLYRITKKFKIDK